MILHSIITGLAKAIIYSPIFLQFFSYYRFLLFSWDLFMAHPFLKIANRSLMPNSSENLHFPGFTFNFANCPHDPGLETGPHTHFCTFPIPLTPCTHLVKSHAKNHQTSLPLISWSHSKNYTLTVAIVF